MAEGLQVARDLADVVSNRSDRRRSGDVVLTSKGNSVMPAYYFSSDEDGIEEDEEEESSHPRQFIKLSKEQIFEEPSDSESENDDNVIEIDDEWLAERARRESRKLHFVSFDISDAEDDIEETDVIQTFEKSGAKQTDFSDIDDEVDVDSDQEEWLKERARRPSRILGGQVSLEISDGSDNGHDSGNEVSVYANDIIPSEEVISIKLRDESKSVQTLRLLTISDTEPDNACNEDDVDDNKESGDDDGVNQEKWLKARARRPSRTVGVKGVPLEISDDSSEDE